MPEASTTKLPDGTFLIIPDDEGTVDLSPLGVPAGQRFMVETLGEGTIQLTPVESD